MSYYALAMTRHGKPSSIGKVRLYVDINGQYGVLVQLECDTVRLLVGESQDIASNRQDEGHRG